MDKDALYETIDDDNDMPDQEKRDTYFGEIANDEAREQWKNDCNK
jgi:hypothetical protein